MSKHKLTRGKKPEEEGVGEVGEEEEEEKNKASGEGEVGVSTDHMRRHTALSFNEGANARWPEVAIGATTGVAACVASPIIRKYTQ